MVIEKPHIDRKRVLAEECRRREVEVLSRALLALLREEECLGLPEREGDRIVVVVRPPGRARDERASEGRRGAEAALLP